MFNVPPIVTAIVAAAVLVHALRVFVLSPHEDVQVLLLFAFIPARYAAPTIAQLQWPGGYGADIWTFVTYAFLHGDWTHLVVNLIWLLAFGSAVARRFRTLRFTALFLVTAAAGAAAHLATHAGETVVVIGASAAISGCMAAAARFMFQRGAPLGLWSGGGPRAYDIPAAPLTKAMRDPRVLIFLGVWFALNLLFGVGSFPLTDDGQSVAWEAHLGGFLAGLILFPLFDPVPRARATTDDDKPQPARAPF